MPFAWLAGMRPNILSHTIRWLLERIEHFPIPVEEALWAYAYCLSGPPGHESFSFPLPPHDGGGPAIRDERPSVGSRAGAARWKSPLGARLSRAAHSLTCPIP